MSLATPQSITINAVATDCHRIEDSALSSTYRSQDGTLKFRVSHQENKTRIRRMVRLDQTIVAADPLTAENAYQSASVHLVIDEPKVGFSDTQLGYLVEALKTWLSSANQTAVLGSRH